MASKRPQQHSSFNEYADAIHKLNPQLKSLLSNISALTATLPQQPPDSTELETPAGSRSASHPTVRRSGTPRRKTTVPVMNEQEVQAVTNSGKIVYGVVREDGKLEVRGSVGEIKEDLLGLEFVNAGRKKTKSKYIINNEGMQ